MSELVYLACPYSHDDPVVRHARFEAANKASAALMRAGVLIFSPISHTHPIAEHDLPKGWDFWGRYDREYLVVCRAMIVLTLEGYATSNGVKAEVSIMREMKKPIFWLRPDELVGDIAKRLRGL